MLLSKSSDVTTRKLNREKFRRDFRFRALQIIKPRRTRLNSSHHNIYSRTLHSLQQVKMGIKRKLTLNSEALKYDQSS